MTPADNYLNWRHLLRDAFRNSIDDDFFIIDRPVLTELPDGPFKVNVTTVILCNKGQMEGAVGLRPFRAAAPCLVVLPADHILELERVSDDFSARVLVMSQRFTDNLLTDVHDRLPLSLSVEKRPCLPLTDEAYAGIDNYFVMMKRAATMTVAADRLRVARHLMLAFMYGTRAYFHPDAEGGGGGPAYRDRLAERFLDLVRHDYRRERQLGYYADRLCLSAKHLARQIKMATGKAANAWIDEHVILEARALLRSTDMPIGQISDELHFDNASFFAKYFKRHVGLTPGQYRRREGGA